MNILDTLHEEHEMVDGLFQAIKDAQSTEDKAALVAELVDALSKHTRAEEQAVYVTLDDDEMISHATEEHREADMMLRRLEGTGVDRPNFPKFLEKLEESVKHHVEEEEGEIFDRLRELHSDVELAELAEAFEVAKGE